MCCCELTAELTGWLVGLESKNIRLPSIRPSIVSFCSRDPSIILLLDPGMLKYPCLRRVITACTCGD